MPEIRRYRKTATVLAYQVQPGVTVTIETLEGVATVEHPDWHLTANTERREQWPVGDDYFSGVNGYEPTGEFVDGLAVYRKKPGADVLAYEVDTDDHPPITDGMQHLAEAFRPPRGYRVATQLDGTHVRAIEPAVFVDTYAPVEG